MNAAQRRKEKRKVLCRARRLGIPAPSWMSTWRAEQLIREEMNRREREAKRASKAAQA